MNARASEVLARAEETRHSMKEAVSTLKAARISAGLSIENAADRAGISPEELGLLEEGQMHDVDISTVFRYADSLGKRLLFQISDR